MSTDPSFVLVVSDAFGGESSLRLKDGQIRFRGSWAEALGRSRVQTDEAMLQRFQAALDALDVWSWRDDYHPEELDCVVEDGRGWSFAAAIGGRSCLAAGANAYPSHASPRVASLDPERFGLLLAAIQDVFGLDGLDA